MVYTVGLIVFIFYLAQRFLRPESKQIYISYAGSRSLPKLVLKVAGINKIKATKLEKLSSVDKRKVKVILERLRSITWANLTFIDSQNLVHVRLQDKDYFLPLDREDNDLVTERLGLVGKEVLVEFTLHRRKQGWLKSPLLTGYLVSSYGLKPGEKELEILYEFPEDLITRLFFIGSLKKRYNLQEDGIADYHTNDLGDGEGVYHKAYDQEHRNGSNFRFQVF